MLPSILVMRVGNPEGRSVFAEALAGIFNGVVVPSAKAKAASKQKAGRSIPRRPFVVYGPGAGAREVTAAARALRRGWCPAIITCRTFSLPALHSEAWRVAVLPVNEPVYEPGTLRRLLDDPRERAALVGWTVDGAAAVERDGLPSMPASMLRATAAAVA